MNLGEIFFYVLTGLVLLFSFFTYILIEDIKLFSIFKRMFVVCLFILIIGVILTLFDLNFLPNYNTIYIYSLPLIILLLNRSLFWINNRLFGEPFVYAGKIKMDFLTGFWYEKELDIRNITLVNKIYYFYYSALHLFMLIPIYSFYFR
jgi:hypothetical protein